MASQPGNLPRQLSQRTLVAMWQTLEVASSDFGSDMLYAHDFPEWFVAHTENHYSFDWEQVLRGLRSRRFFYPGYCDSLSNITGQFLDTQGANALGEELIERLAALLATTPVRTKYGEHVRRQLELDGYGVDENHLRLVPLEGQVSQAEEEDQLTTLIRRARFPSEAAILKHVGDAGSQYVAGNGHSSLNESRSFIQALIDDIATETDGHGGHTHAVPGGTANRIHYLRQVGFFTSEDEMSAFRSAWSMLSSGSHPGVPAKSEARIGLVLALEFGQLLALKFCDWKNNQCKQFSKV
jgi:hypothetical protein